MPERLRGGKQDQCACHPVTRFDTYSVLARPCNEAKSLDATKGPVKRSGGLAYPLGYSRQQPKVRLSRYADRPAPPDPATLLLWSRHRRWRMLHPPKDTRPRTTHWRVAGPHIGNGSTYMHYPLHPSAKKQPPRHRKRFIHIDFTRLDTRGVRGIGREISEHALFRR